MRNEPQTLSNVMDKTRQLTNTYFSLLKDVDPHRVFESEGVKLNNVFWIKAHLSITENFLLIRSLGGEKITIPWARQFGLGSSFTPKEECPPWDEVNQVFDEIHGKAIAHISTISEDLLDQPNVLGFEFLGEKTFRSNIVHAIRHEGTHAGHLSWLCKLHGIRTI